MLALIAGSGLALAKSKFSVHTGEGTIPPGGADGAETKCPKGSELLLGGVRLPPDKFENLTLNELRRSERRGWDVAAEDEPFGTGSEIKSIAYCGPAKQDGRSPVELGSVPDSTVADEPGTLTVKCPKGTRVGFGGFAYAPTAGVDLFVSSLTRPSNRSWRVGIYNFGPPRPATSQVWCSKFEPKTKPHSKTVSVQPASTRTAKATCPKGSVLAFGGYRGEVTASNAFVLLRSLERVSARSWRVTASNVNQVNAGELTAIAYCAKSK